MERFIEWRVITDVILLTAIIYYIYRTLLSTGTWKIALGLTLAVLLAMVARVLGLQGTEWIFSNFSSIALLMLLIIFQPEIRRILERSFFFGQFQRQEKNVQLCELLDQVLFDLAERRWGALIVLPGQVPLRQWVTEGIVLNGVPSLQLFLSIFDSSSPGHDGAVIMENDRVERFAVHLPLSRTNKLSKMYGTRHNAALGLAEKTDALVFIVSEERGVVSVCRDGSLIALKKRGDAGKFIDAHFQERMLSVSLKKPRKRKLPALGGIIGSFAIAVLLWATLIQPKTELREMLYTVPIEYQGKDKNILLTEKPAEVKLLIGGPIAALQSIDSSQFRVKVDISSLNTGRHKLRLTEENVDVPERFRVVDIDPSVFEIELKQLMSRNIPIKPQIIGRLPEGYTLTNVEVSPADVELLIPPEEQEVVNSLTTTPIYLSGLRESTTMYCKVIVAEGLQAKDRKISDVKVRLTINGTVEAK